MGKHTFEGLAGMKPRELERILRDGKTPDMDSLVGFELRGWNVVEPLGVPVVALLGIRRFAKGFYQRPGEKKPSEGGQLLGYNVDIQRGGVTDPWVEKPSPENPKRRGFYVVYPPKAGPRPVTTYDDALFLDYTARKDKNGVFDGGPLYGDGGLKDFLVQVDPDDPDLFLGKAFMRVPPMTVPAGFFVVQRWRPADFREEA